VSLPCAASLFTACGGQPPAPFAISAATFPDTVSVSWPAQAGVDSFRAELVGDQTLTRWIAGGGSGAVFTGADGVAEGAHYVVTVHAVRRGRETRSENAPAVVANGFPWDEWYPTSLHATGQGLQTFYSAENGGLEQFAKVPYAGLACRTCHEPAITGRCASCHGTPTPGPGAQVDAGVAEGQACTRCHSRQLGEITAGFSDVHRDAGMTCMDCHTLADVMGDGTRHRSRLEPDAVDARCEGCHAAVAGNAYHDAHRGTVDCATCHMQGLVTCFNCHYQSPLPDAASQLLRRVTDWMFLANRDGKVHPANMHSLVYEGHTLLILAPGYSHTIARNAVSGCGDCHASANVLDLDADSVLVAAAFDGAGGVTTARGRIPVPFNFEQALVFDFLVYEPTTNAWSLHARGQEVTQLLFAEPLTAGQLRKLRQPVSITGIDR
jgi:hypothetical protein